jgi:6-phosphofructokinase 1
MEKKYGFMVGIRNGDIVSVPLGEASSKTKFLPSDHPLIQTARDTGIVFGD